MWHKAEWMGTQRDLTHSWSFTSLTCKPLHHPSRIYIYIYIYICVCVCVYLGSISSLMQISLNIIDILCLHIFFWIRSYSRITFIVFGGNWFVLSIVVCIPSTFCPTLGHHQGRIYYKSDVTFVLAYYYCVRASLPLKIMAFAFKCNSIISASS